MTSGGPPLGGNWLFDSYDPDDLQGHRIARTVVATQTQFQRVEILENDALGRFLVLDGKMQSAASDEFIYHEALVHPAMTAHPGPRSVLILGGGEGATLREVLRHPTVERAVMVDLDEELVGLCRRYLPSWHDGAFDDPRAEVRCQDAWAYLREAPGRFDVVISDVTDFAGDGLAAALFGPEFYALVAQALSAGGYFASQALAIRFDGADRHHMMIRDGLGRALGSVWTYTEFIPSFDSLWGFVLASAAPGAARPGAREIGERLAERGLGGARYFDAITYERIFALPKNLRQTFAG
jgi:spermidine synthase